MIALLVQAEFQKLFSRTSARLGLVLSVVIGVLAPAMLRSVGGGLEVNGENLQSMLPYHGAGGVAWALELRNLHILQAALLVLAASSLAGELNARTLREDLVRPVRRDAVLLAKWLSLVLWDAASLGLTLVASAASGAALLGVEGDWLVPLPGYAASLAADAGLLALALLASIVLQSVPAVVGGGLLLTVLDRFVGLGVWGLAMASENLGLEETPAFLKMAAQIWPWTPYAAFGVWKGYRPAEPVPFQGIEGAWVWEGFVVLAIFTVVGLLGAKAKLDRTDVP